MERDLEVLMISHRRTCSGNGRGFSVSGMYGDPEQYFDRVKNGGYVIDNRPVKNIVAAVLRAPLLDFKLDSDEIDSLSDSDVATSVFAQAVMSEPGNDFGAMLKHEKQDKKMRPKRKFGSLDGVGINLYLDYWREEGSRIGKIENGEIKWEAK